MPRKNHYTSNEHAKNIATIQREDDHPHNLLITRRGTADGQENRRKGGKWGALKEGGKGVNGRTVTNQNFVKKDIFLFKTARGGGWRV